MSFSNAKQNPYFFAFLSVFFWATAATAFKIALRYIDSYSLLLFSVFFACVYLFLILLCNKKISLLLRFSKKDYLHSVLLGFLNPFLYYFILFKAYSLLPAHIAQPLNFIWPLITVLLSVSVLKHQIKWFHLIALTISFLGVIIISTKGKFLDIEAFSVVGICLALFSSFVWASFFIFNVKDKRDETLKLMLNFVFGFFFILIYGLFHRNLHYDWRGIMASAYVGFFEMAITFVFWLKALSLTDSAAKVSNLIFLTPFLSLICIAVVLKENIHFSAIIGLILIVVGIGFQRLQNPNRKKKLL